ncbi:MAG: hypothetical protein ACRDRL_27235 [Sciscionella sp.]
MVLRDGDEVMSGTPRRSETTPLHDIWCSMLREIGSGWFGQPGATFDEGGEGSEEADVLFDGGGQVTSDRAEWLGAGAQTAGSTVTVYR